MHELKQYDTVQNQIDELRLSSQPANKVMIWVEGNDWKLYHRFFNPDMVDHQGRTGGYSCHTAIDSYKEFKRQYPTRLAIVIRDADFKRVNGESLVADDDIFYADSHDHEMMCMCQVKVREALKDNFMLGDKGDTLFQKIFNELQSLSYFKWYSYNKSCGYNFSTLGNLSAISDDFFTDLNKIEEKVYGRSVSERTKKGITDPLKRIDLKEFSDFIALHPDPDYYEITNGHDFYCRINYYLKKIDANNARREDALKEVVYTAFSFVFQNTQLYSRLSIWCNNNTNILKAS